MHCWQNLALIELKILYQTNLCLGYWFFIIFIINIFVRLDYCWFYLVEDGTIGLIWTFWGDTRGALLSQILVPKANQANG